MLQPRVIVRPPVLAVLGLALLSIPIVHAADLPRKSPDLTIQMNTGKPLQISQYKGKAVVLAFILLTCPHCQKAVSCLSKDASEFASRGLQVLAAAVEADAPSAVPVFIQKFKPAFPVGFNTDSNVVMAYLQHPPNMVPHMPMLVMIDRDGMIRQQYEGNDPLLEEKVIEANLRKGIEDLLKAPPATRKTVALPKKAS